MQPEAWKRVLAEEDWGEKFNLLLDEDNHNKDMHEKEVKDLLKKNKVKWSEFNEWMRGQTCPVLEDGSCGYFQHDVERFIRHKLQGEKLIWD